RHRRLRMRHADALETLGKAIVDDGIDLRLGNMCSRQYGIIGDDDVDDFLRLRGEGLPVRAKDRVVAPGGAPAPEAQRHALETAVLASATIDLDVRAGVEGWKPDHLGALVQGYLHSAWVDAPYAAV